MKTEFRNIQQQRVYIANFVKRYYKGDKYCIICGNDNTSIVHNEENPYEVSFVCNECRTKHTKEQLKNLPKTNLLIYVEQNKKFSHSKNLVLDGKMKFILEGALKTNKSLTEYLRENKLSYTKYKQAVKMYEKDVKPIANDLRNHFNLLRAQKVAKKRLQN